MNKKIVIPIIILLAIGLGFYFKDALFGIYNSTAINLQDFNKTELGHMIEEMKKEILTPPPLNIGGESNDVVLTKARVIAETNIQRYDNGMLTPLVENAKLSAAAKAKAEDMFLNQYFDHVSPSGVDPGTLVKNAGYNYIVTGENLILGNFEDEPEVVRLWMESPGHRENILHERFTEIGVAIVKGTYKGKTAWIGVQEFGLPFSACDEPSADLKAKIELNKNTLDQLAVKIENKRDEIERTNRNSPQYNALVDEYNQLVAQYNVLNDETKAFIAQYNNQVNNFNNCVSGE